MPALRPRARLAIVVTIACLPLLLHAMSARATSPTATTSVTSTAGQTTTSSTTTTTTTTASSTSTSTSTSTTTSSTESAPTTSSQTTRPPVADRPLTLHAAGDPSDTIVDFKFSPATITIHVGDTITWTNQGKQPHTATANDGSFDTGTLKTGQSASHTFTKAGTFAYICSIHPFMHGTVVVQGSNGGSGSGSGSSGSASSPSSGTTTNSTPTTTGTSNTTATLASGSGLPNTGTDLRNLLVAGVVLLGLGALLRRQVDS